MNGVKVQSLSLGFDQTRCVVLIALFSDWGSVFWVLQAWAKAMKAAAKHFKKTTKKMMKKKTDSNGHLDLSSYLKDGSL